MTMLQSPQQPENDSPIFEREYTLTSVESPHKGTLYTMQCAQTGMRISRLFRTSAISSDRSKFIRGMHQELDEKIGKILDA